MRVLSIFVALALVYGTNALRFYLKDGEERCFTFDAEPGALQRGEALVERKGGNGGSNAEVNVRIVDTHPSKSHLPPLYSGLLKGSSKFSFRVPEHDHHHRYDFDDDDDEDEEEYAGHRAGYRACVRLTKTAGAVSFNIKSAMRDYDSDQKASDDGVKGVARAMREMHETLAQLTKDISRLQQREHKLMRKNQSVGSRVVTLAALALFVLVASTALQVVYFKSFFKSKKLL